MAIRERRHKGPSSRITTDRISPTNRGGIPTLRRTSNRTRPISNDPCILVVGKARASTAGSILRRDPSPNPSGVRTTARDQAVHPEHQGDHLQAPRTSGRVRPIQTPRTDIHRGSNPSSREDRVDHRDRTRPISRVNSSPGIRCPQRRRVLRCDHRPEEANRSLRRCKLPVECPQEGRECHPRRSHHSNRAWAFLREEFHKVHRLGPRQPRCRRRAKVLNRWGRRVDRRFRRRAPVSHRNGTLSFRRTASSRRHRFCTSASA